MIFCVYEKQFVELEKVNEGKGRKKEEVEGERMRKGSAAQELWPQEPYSSDQHMW